MSILIFKIKIFHHKYSIFSSKFQKFLPTCTKQCKKLCAAQTKNKNKNKQKKGGGEKYNGLLTHFICRVNMIVCLPGSEIMGTGMGTMPWVGTGTSPACQEVTGMGPRPYPWVQVQTFVSG